MTFPDAALIETLLNMSEGDTLDFKRDQYPLVTDEQKAELAKDILAFANAWKTTDAHIVIGANENAGGRALLVGVTSHLSDADIQQLVNGKTNRPVHFEYVPVKVDGLQLGILCAKAEQQRPIYLLKPFGKLRANVVYIRRGTSTAEAPPDEIARIGSSAVSSAQEPSLELELADPTERLRLGASVTITSRVLREFPSSGPRSYGMVRAGSQLPGSQSDTNAMKAIQAAMAQADLERSRRAPLLDPEGAALYRKTMGLLRPLGFWVRNTGKVLVEDVRIVVTIAKAPGLRVVDELPVEPPRSIMDRYRPPLGGGATTTRVADRGGTWEVTARLHKIQPNAAAWSEPFWIGSADVDEVCLAAQIFGDNIAEVVEVPLRVRIDTTESYFEVGDDAERHETPS